MTVLDRRPAASPIGIVQVSAAGVLWGTGGLVVTLLHEREGLGAMTASAWRMAIAAVALLAFVALTGRLDRLRTVARRHPVRAAVVGVGTATYQALYFVAVLAVGVSVATVVALGLAPVLAATWEHARSRTRPAPRQLLVLLAALAGLVLISATGHPGGTTPHDRPGLGIVLATAAGVVYAATTVLGHRVARDTDPVALTTYSTTAGAVVLLPFLGVAAASGAPVLAGDPVTLGLLAYLGIGTMALSYGLLYAGLRTTPGSAATVATLLEPVSAAVLAAVVLGERLAWPGLVGGALILLAVAALRGPQTEEEPRAAPPVVDH